MDSGGIVLERPVGFGKWKLGICVIVQLEAGFGVWGFLFSEWRRQGLV